METDRLVLRPYVESDAPRVLDTLGRPDVVRWLGSPVPMAGLDDAREWIDDGHRREEADPFDLARAVVVRETGVVAGKVSLARCHRRGTGEFHGEYEVGWHLHPDSVGHGYATEAAGALLDHVFERGLDDVWCGVFVGNEASTRVAERLGLPFLGVGPDPWYDGDSLLYRIFRTQWLARRAG